MVGGRCGGEANTRYAIKLQINEKSSASSHHPAACGVSGAGSVDRSAVGLLGRRAGVAGFIGGGVVW